MPRFIPIVRPVVLLLVNLGSGEVALCQTPVVKNLFLNSSSLWMSSSSSGFVDIPQSLMNVEIPRGQAVITWSITASPNGGDAYYWIRPAIGEEHPPLGLNVFLKDEPGGTGHRPIAGSWSTTTTGGNVDVRLQVQKTGGSGAFTLHEDTDDSIAWTLVVFPNAGAVPAISTWGLTVLGILVLVAGAVLIRRLALA